jgi:hypothetical protein
MNERIFELAKQAGFIEEDGGNNLHVFDGYEAITCTEELKKFAELLIDECAKHAEHAKGMDVDYQKYFKELLFGVE